MRRVTVSGLLARKLRLALTALAIVLGVTFVTGHAGPGRHAQPHVQRPDRRPPTSTSASRSAARRRSATAPPPTSTAPPTAGRSRESIAPAVGRLPGVVYVYGSVGGYAQFMARDGNAIGGGGGSTLGFSFDPNRRLSPYRLVQGRAPRPRMTWSMDKATATKYHFTVGDQVLMNLPDRARTFTIAGIVDLRLRRQPGGGHAGRVRAADGAGAVSTPAGHYDTINVLAAPGRRQRQAATGDRRGSCPRGCEVVSGQAVASQLSNAVDNELSFISTALLIFALHRAVRRRRSRSSTRSRSPSASGRASWRCCASSGRADGRCSARCWAKRPSSGLDRLAHRARLGVLAALGLKALLKAFGIVLPSAPLVFEARTPVVAIAVGVGVTVLSAILPARRAVRIPPVAALVDHSEDGRESLGRGRRGRRRRRRASPASAPCWRG